MIQKQTQKIKDSGISWVGEIPEDWKTKRLKFAVKLRSDKSKDFSESRPYVGLENVESGTGKLIDVNEEMEEADAKQFEKGDVLFGKLRPYLAKVILASFPGRCSSEFLVLEGKDFDPEFLSYLLISDGCIKTVDSSTYGAKMPRAEWNFIGNMNMPIPTIEEQKLISKIISEKLFHIKHNIIKNQECIELLQEKRQAMINQAITKGLDPNVPVKDSGIHWIGEIPDHWEKRKLSWSFSNIGSGTTPDSENERYYNGKILWVNSGDLNDGYVSDTENKVTELALDHYSSLKIFPKNTLIVAMYGATIGKLGILEKPATTNQACCNLSHVKDLDTKYLYYWFLTFRKDIISMGQGGGQPNISQGIIKSLICYSPDLDEQKQITYYLDSKIPNIENLISIMETQIKKLQEYRQSLISNLVTGKKVQKMSKKNSNLVD